MFEFLVLLNYLENYLREHQLPYMLTVYKDRTKDGFCFHFTPTITKFFGNREYNVPVEKIDCLGQEVNVVGNLIIRRFNLQRSKGEPQEDKEL